MTWIALPVMIVVGYTAVYVLGCLLVAIGVRRLKPNPLPDPLPRVSVVVCARNEEHNIARCLENIRAIDYPRDRIEAILVDDESTDRTLEIMREYAERDPLFRVLSAAEEPRTLPGKQRPLNMGIRESTGEFVLITDADIAVRPGWVRAHLGTYSESIGIVGGTTRVDTSSGKLFHRLQCCELVSKHAVAMGCVGLGFPLSIMGNNISFRRDAYDRIGGLLGMGRSVVEDMAMMNAVVEKTPYTLGWVSDRGGTVVSAPEDSLKAFINQRFRWIFEVSDLAGIGKIMLAMESLMLASFAASLALIPWAAVPLLATIAGWNAGYALFFAPSPGREKGDILYIPVVLAFQMLEVVLLGRRKLFGGKGMVWKGREYRRQD